jgi:small conductance mechanosensitive channel
MEAQLPLIIRPYFGLAKSLLIAVLILVVGWIVAKIVARIVVRAVERSKVDLALGRFLAAIARYAVLAAAVIASLGAVGVQTTSLVAVFASAGLAIGLALQGSLSHFASGTMLLFFRPIHLKDFVTIGGNTGTVDDIGLFATTLITPNNEKVIIPNAKITGDSIVNHTALGTRRGIVSAGVAYGSDIAKVQQVLLGAVSKVDVVLADPAPEVAFVDLGSSSLNFDVKTWCEAPNYLDMLHKVRKAAYDALNAAGIEIPFNQIVVHQAPAS